MDQPCHRRMPRVRRSQFKTRSAAGAVQLSPARKRWVLGESTERNGVTRSIKCMRQKLKKAMAGELIHPSPVAKNYEVVACQLPKRGYGGTVPRPALLPQRLSRMLTARTLTTRMLASLMLPALWWPVRMRLRWMRRIPVRSIALLTFRVRTIRGRLGVLRRTSPVPARVRRPVVVRNSIVNCVRSLVRWPILIRASRSRRHHSFTLENAWLGGCSHCR